MLKLTIWDRILIALGRCPHHNITTPVSPRTKPGDPPGPATCHCWDCGGHFYYDYEDMRIGPPVEEPQPRRWNDGLRVSIEGE